MAFRVAHGEGGYSQRLGRLPRPPAAIWVDGRLPVDGDRTIAIVGARAATRQGRERATVLAGELGRRGIAVVSGGAFGIDAAAHQGALDAEAPTFAVLGCGVDVVYPDRHAALYQRIARSGGLISEYPPGTQPRPGQFPARNRIIAALSDAVLVVEANVRSGALITAQHARKRGQILLAVPGSPGTDSLLHAGQAWPVTGVADVLDALAGRRPEVVHAAPTERLAPLVAALIERADDAAGLARRLGLPLPRVMGMLVEAEMDGVIQRGPALTYEARRGH